jgi:hypothetical protein
MHGTRVSLEERKHCGQLTRICGSMSDECGQASKRQVHLESVCHCGKLNTRGVHPASSLSGLMELGGYLAVCVGETWSKHVQQRACLTVRGDGAHHT